MRGAIHLPWRKTEPLLSGLLCSGTAGTGHRADAEIPGKAPEEGNAETCTCGKDIVKGRKAALRDRPDCAAQTGEKCGNDEVSRTVHKIELLNQERAAQGLPPLSYGKAVALLKL